MIAGLNILLVEDEPIVGFALEDMLLDQGAVPELVPSRQAAEESLSHRRFDAAIVDVNLRGEFSYPLASLLVEKGCPLVFATGYGTGTHPPEFADTPTVVKPYNLAAILAALEIALAKSKS